MGKIEKILKKGPVEGQTTEVYPVTSTKAVYDENNKRLDNIITGLQESVYLKTPIPISTDNTTESIAQNVKNIADYVEKAKAAGIEDVNGMAVTCLIDNDYSGVGYFYPENEGGPYSIFGVIPTDDLYVCYIFRVFSGTYDKNSVLVEGSYSIVTSSMLAQGARRPIILTPETTEVDEETYQKLLSDNVDVIFKDSYNILYYLFDVDKNVSVNDIEIRFVNTIGSIDTTDPSDYYFSVVSVKISKNAPHTVITESTDHSLQDVLNYSGYLNKSILAPVLQNINLAGTDADRKAKLDQFAVNWKALTGADTLDGARFVGYSGEPDNFLGIFTYSSLMGGYSAIATKDSLSTYQVFISPTGAIISNSLFYHLQPIIIRTDNTDYDMAANVAAIKKYIDNLTFLGVYTYDGFTIPVSLTGNECCGYLICNKYHEGDRLVLSGTVFFEGIAKIIVIDETGRYEEIVEIAGTNPLNTTSDNMVDAINEVNTLAKNKQDILTSGTNIKTINNQSLLGSGNIEISAPSITVDTTMSDTSTNPVQNKVIKAYIDGLVGNVAAQLAQI